MDQPIDQYFWDAYLHWAQILDTVIDGPFAQEAQTQPAFGFKSVSPLNGYSAQPSASYTAYEPIFVRLKQGLSSDMKAALIKEWANPKGPNFATVMALAELHDFSSLLSSKDNQKPLTLDPFELLLGIEAAIHCDIPIEFFMYRERATTFAEHTAYKDHFDIIDVGPMAFTTGVARGDDELFVSPPKGSPLKIGAVIDNDIGFLNDAFCTNDTDGPRRSRFAGLWLQARVQHTNTGIPLGQQVLLGRELDQSAINDILSRYGTEEANAYRDINTQLQAWEPFQSAPLKNTHGTAVAALAYGNDFFNPDENPLEIPLLGVQLPPEAAADTSGAYSESYIVQGVRWLCWKARQLSSSPTLVINISYGALAGPKDGSKFLEEQIKREVICAEKLGLTVHVVYAWGNGRNNKQVVHVKVKPKCEQDAPNWVIPRGQRLPSFMEIRAIGPKPDDGTKTTLKNVPDHLEFVLTSPSQEELIFTHVPGVLAVPPMGPTKASEKARFYVVQDRDFSADTHPNDNRLPSTGALQIAIAPTVPLLADPPVPVAEDGDWTLTIRNTSPDIEVDLVLQIQRGDTAPGFVVGGLQSHFEGAYTMGYTDDVPKQNVVATLTNAGTNSAYTTAVHPRIHTVGALQNRYGMPTAAEYSAEGAHWASVEKPSDNKVVDELFTTGMPVTGTYSGTRTRVSGTSAAAALKSRDLVK